MDILDPSALLSAAPKLLPSSSISLSSPQDALALLLHTVMATLGFRLVATDESSPGKESGDNHLPEGWNKNGPDSYTFRYKHEQSTLVFLLKIVKLGNRTLVHGIATEDEKTASLDVLTADYLSASFFPYNPSSSESPLVHGFISSSRVKDFITLYKINILQKLVPGLRKDGYQEESTVPTTAASTSNPPPSQPPARLPSPPFSMHEPFHHPYPARNPLSVGRSDLDPLGGMGVFNPPPLSGGHGGDGMFVGPEHPLFRDRFATPGGGRRWGGDGWLPPMGAPPGARFDPIGPGMGPLGGGLPGNPGQPPRRPPGSGGPDNDEFMPPGMGDMFS